MPLRRPLLLAAAALLLAPGTVHAAVGAGTPFPTNLMTTPDATQITGLRVDLPTPDCATHPSDCEDVAVLNRLDGFNVQPRVSIPFDGPIDPSTVSSATVRLYDLGCLACAPVGIDQAVWEPAANTLHAESAELLKQHETYLLVATTGLHAADGSAIDRTSFLHDLNFGQTKDEHAKQYRTALRDALHATGTFTGAVAASIFTTQSITADLEKIRAQLGKSTPAPARVSASFARSEITAIVWNRQATTTGPLSASFVPVPALDAFPGSVGRVVFGTYDSPDYETPAKVIPATGTLTGTPTPHGTNTISYTLFLPAGTEPAEGWPVTIFGHGFTDSKQGAPWAVASSLAHSGIASIAINVVGHGGGPGGNLTIFTPTGQRVIPDGGRGIDQNGDGTIDSTEGVNAAPPDTLVSNRDGLRQTVIDLMQLVREIQVGLDVDANGTADLDATRIFYAGQSFGGIYGLDFVALEPDLVAGLANVPGGPIIEIARLSPSFRPLVGLALLGRTPSLYNAVPNPQFTSFVENMPLRGEPIRIDTVPGASAIQELIDRDEWAQQSANPAALAPYVDHPVIIQFAKGDRTVPNPTTTAILRAGDLAGRATYFRNDIAGPGGTPLYTNPHTFLTGIANPATALAALQAQAQIAAFFASNGAQTIDPDGAGPVFEVPIVPPLPETTGF
jgi:pimeloyl-ACP methyl ester carboxylesterase